jgi:cytochrome c556
MVKLVTFAAILTCTALVAGCSSEASKPEMTVQQLMAKQVQPTAKLYWDAVQYISDENGNRDIAPTTDAEWERTRKAAEDLGKLGTLLQTPAYTEGRNADWTKFSKALVDISKQAEKAATDKSPDAVFEVGGTMYNVCSACHMAYPAESATAEPAKAS